MATGTVTRNPESAGAYSYSSQPRTVHQQQKYRDVDTMRPCNIMYDKRVVRGNTYALHTLPASSQPNPLELQKQQETRRRVLAHKRAREQMRIHSPPPVEGRKHIDVQTELYLEEITDRVEEVDVHTQTDAFLDRPPTPLFIPAKTGMDVATQIEEGDLFNFDLEVQPILEVLVGKTVEQALLEVMEEEELAALREQQRIFEGNRNAELIETQRLEEQERRRREEKERRMQQQREALMKEKETAEKVAARAFAHSYLSDLVPAVFTSLSNKGFFYDPIQRNIETALMPWLMSEAQKILDKKLTARLLLDTIIRRTVKRKLGITSPVPTPKDEQEPLATEEQPPSIGEGEQPPPPTSEGEQPPPPTTEGEGAGDKPSGEEHKPSADEDKPTEGDKPEGDKPAEEGDKPAEEGGDKPVSTEEGGEGDKPAEDKPAEEGDKPAEDKPAEEGDKPAEEGENPTEEGDKPAEDKPTEEGDKPADMPAEDGEKPADEKPLEGQGGEGEGDAPEGPVEGKDEKEVSDPPPVEEKKEEET